MPLTTPQLLGTIIEVDPSIDPTPFIAMADTLVMDVLATAGYESARLELIERNLAAHFYRMMDPAVASEAARGISQSLREMIGLVLANTTYGQTAMVLDTQGLLAALSKRTERGSPRKVRIFAMGGDGCHP